ncbi:MAG: response regulator transcription factor [Betaproteobacteria bacterium]|jgi:DNA-binding NarL/FixJ family response regulator|nr:response regulator transcription factor [Betaproteobacteria bacterium]
MPVRILLADDHRIVREGVAALLRREPDLEIVGEAADGFDAVRLARELKPDIVITDISMPGLNGIDAIRRILADVPGVRTLCLSVHDETRLVGAVMDAGASGYLLKECAYEELLLAVRALLANRVYISPSIAGVLMKDYRERRSGGAAATNSELTTREREVLQLIAEGLSTKQIADRLHVSVKTVGTHREHILAKLKLTGTAELTRYAIREGLSGLDVGARVPPEGRSR